MQSNPALIAGLPGAMRLEDVVLQEELRGPIGCRADGFVPGRPRVLDESA